MSLNKRITEILAQELQLSPHGEEFLLMRCQGCRKANISRIIFCAEVYRNKLVLRCPVCGSAHNIEIKHALDTLLNQAGG